MNELLKLSKEDIREMIKYNQRSNMELLKNQRDKKKLIRVLEFEMNISKLLKREKNYGSMMKQKITPRNIGYYE